MTSSAKSNMYEVNVQSTLDVYGAFVKGSKNDVLLAMSREGISPEAADALTKSADALGYGGRSLSFAQTHADGADLGTSDVLSAVEGLDPLGIIACDEQTATLLGEAFHRAVPPDSSVRLLGRPVVAFRNLDELLQADNGKQRVWALLKKLPHLG